MASRTEKARRKLETISSYLINIINNADMNSKQKMILIKNAFSSNISLFQNFNSAFDEYFSISKNELKGVKTTEAEIILEIKMKYNFGFKLSATKIYDCLKKAINNFHNAILSAKNRNTTKNRMEVNKYCNEIKFLIEQEEKISANTKKEENSQRLKTLLDIQNNVLKLSNCLKSIENTIKNEKYFQDNTLEFEDTSDLSTDSNAPAPEISECRQTIYKINKSVNERENNINSLIVLQSSINALKLSLKPKSAPQKNKTESYNLDINNIAKIQHYIPQFFQRNWKNQIETNNSREENMYRIYKYDKKNNIFTTTTIKNCCQEKSLYEPNKAKPNNYFEKQYCKLEVEISHKLFEMLGMIEKMVFKNGNPETEKINNTMQIIQEQKEMLMKLLAHLSSRHPQSVYGDITHINHISDYSLTENQKQIHNYNNLNKEGKTRVILNYLALEDNRFEEKLKDYKVQIFISSEPNIFFSDNITNKIVTKDSEYFLPLTPYVLVWFTKNIFITDKKILPINKGIYEKFVKTYFNNNAVKEIYGIKQQYLDKAKEIAEK